MIFHKTHIAGYNGKYEKIDLDVMIYNQGYIPVASSLDLDNLRNNTTQAMGAGTPYWGSYATGLDKKYIQINNIDLSGFANFTPLGLQSVADLVAFTGIYDGNNLTIKNMNFNRPRISGQSSSARGLFCQVTGGMITNIKIVDCVANAIGDNIYCGVLVGTFSQGLIENVTVINCTSYGHQGTGGLIGNMFSSGVANSAVVRDCSTVNCNILSNSSSTAGYKGGIVGRIEQNKTSHTGTTIIEKCFAINNTYSDATFLGNIIGYNRILYGNTIIRDCYAVSGSLEASSVIGGLIGLGQTNRTTVTNCYAVTGTLTATNIGGFMGQSGAVLTNCYYDTQTSGQSDTGKGLPRSTNQMKQGTADSTVDGEAMYTGWDANIWDFGDNNSYPILK